MSSSGDYTTEGKMNEPKDELQKPKHKEKVKMKKIKNARVPKSYGTIANDLTYV